MEPEDFTGINSLSLSADLRIDAICVRFETAWRAGRAPRLEDFLGDTTGGERQTLLWRLLQVELDWRLQNVGHCAEVRSARSQPASPAPAS